MCVPVTVRGHKRLFVPAPEAPLIAACDQRSAKTRTPTDPPKFAGNPAARAVRKAAAEIGSLEIIGRWFITEYEASDGRSDYSEKEASSSLRREAVHEMSSDN